MHPDRRSIWLVHRDPDRLGDLLRRTPLQGRLTTFRTGWIDPDGRLTASPTVRLPPPSARVRVSVAEATVERGRLRATVVRPFLLTDSGADGSAGLPLLRLSGPSRRVERLARRLTSKGMIRIPPPTPGAIWYSGNGPVPYPAQATGAPTATTAR